MWLVQPHGNDREGKRELSRQMERGGQSYEASDWPILNGKEKEKKKKEKKKKKKRERDR